MDITQFTSLAIPMAYTFGLHNNLLSSVSLPRFNQPEYFHQEVSPVTTITNQKSSGRCWMFAGLNMIRRDVVKEYSLPSSFEFSQSYLFFWDKLERMNYLIDTLTELHDQERSLDDRTVNFLMKDPFGDGGQWSMFENLVNKYGLVPKSAYPESTHSSNSRGVNMVLCKMIRDYVAKLYNGKEVNKDDFLKKTYFILVRFFGKPPTEFIFEYQKKNKEIVSNRFTPSSFKDFCKIDLSKYVSVVHDPRNPYMGLYTVDMLNNISGGKSVKYLNLNINRVVELTKESLDKNNPVWFGSDVGQYFSRDKDMLDDNVFSYEKFLGLGLTMNKKDRMNTADSIPSHAMVYSGYHLDGFGNVDYWKIENSWGKRGKYDGHLVCSDKWFKEFTFQVVIDKSLLSDEEAVLWNEGEITTLPLWDPLGTLA